MLLAGSSASAFVMHTTLGEHRWSDRHLTAGWCNASPFCSHQHMLYSTPSGDADTSISDTTMHVTAAAKKATQYSIDLPSTVLLSSSMLSAIVSTGSAFQLTTDGVEPLLGVPATNVLVFTGIPLSFLSSLCHHFEGYC